MTGTKRETLLLVFFAATISSWYPGGKELGSTAPPAEQAASGSTPTAALSFEFFKTKVQPIFLKNRPEHARCYGCHILSNRIFHLERLSPGSTVWTDEQSQRNFQSVLDLVVPGDPASSRLLFHPLAPEAGGDAFHSGGRQFASQDDPDWLVMAEWVRGIRAGGVSEPASQPITRLSVKNIANSTIDVMCHPSKKS